MDPRNLNILYNLFPVHLSLECNNKCYFCYHGDNRNLPLLSFENIRYQLQIISKNFNPEIIITGGEPTIHPFFFQILDTIIQLDFEGVNIESNGRMFAIQSFLDNINTYNIDRYYISLHSSKEKAQDFITNVNGSYQQTIRGIQNLISLGKKVILQSLITRSNFYDLEEILELAHYLKIQQVRFIYPLKEGYAINNYEAISVPLDILLEYLEQCKKIALIYDIHLSLVNI